MNLSITTKRLLRLILGSVFITTLVAHAGDDSGGLTRPVEDDIRKCPDGAGECQRGSLQAAGAIEACIENPRAEPVAEPYTGYTPTGYKGLPEPDDAWFAAVRKIKKSGGAVRYVMKHAPVAQRIEYESIET